MQTARGALLRGDLQAAEAAASQHLLMNPDDPVGLEIAGDIAATSGNLPQACELYRSAVEASSPGTPALFDKLARSWMNDGSPYEAVQVLEELVRVHPDNAKARADYAGLSAALGMSQNAAEHLRWLLRRGQGGVNELIMLADLNVPQTDAAMCDYALKNQPNDLRPRYALAIAASYEDRWESAERELKPVLEKHPDFDPAWALHGRILVALGRSDELVDWREKLPPGTTDWTTYWVAAGLWAENQNNPKQAAQAFWQAVRIDDCHGEALVHLAANLAQLDMPEEAKRVAARAADVNAMHDRIESFFSWRRNSQKASIEVAEAMERLGRPWEAEAWSRAALIMTQELDSSAQQKRQAFLAKLSSDTPWQIPETTVLSLPKLDQIGDFQWDVQQKIASDSSPTASSDGFAATFSDQAADRGLIHTCMIDKSSPEASIAIYQSNAGGCGVLDFDCDGWPDIYLTMIDGSPLSDDSSPNRLFRNRAGSFAKVPLSAGVGDTSFSQGVASGDYNSDGFADLLVASIGINRLYRNNGDGTFRDVTEEVGLSGARWTTSIAIADLDSDGLSDLFEVNYCAGESAYTQECIDSDVNAPRSCSPLVFAAEGDRVWRGTEEGRFEDVTGEWLSEQIPGHGLGVVIGSIDNAEGLDVYVANDMTANQFWSSTRGEQFELREQAAVRGLAVNSRSQSQASMGIALGDADLDGDLDFYLAHFTDDYNTLYEQVSAGTWFDRTEAANLVQPTLSMLAFGTEWIDANNDGALELLVANGNVDDFSHAGHVLRMPSQLFSRNRSGTWQASKATELGPYFERKVIGRALVTLDLNRDGLQDSVVTHLYDPVAALVNETDTESKSIQIFFRGTDSSRDAIGTTFRASVGGQPRMAQLTAGDGFQCSNERCIRIGLGDQSVARDVSVQWPSGQTDALDELEGGRSYLFVEGDAAPIVLHQHN